MAQIQTVLAAVLIFVSGLAAAAEPAPFPKDGWPTSSPVEQGLDPALLAELVQKIRTGEHYPEIHSLLVVKNGYLVVEEYFDGWNAERLHTLQSVSKSFTSAVVGIAIERGAIRGVEEKVLDFFPERKDIQNLDPRKRGMTVADLLTMRSGTDYHERGARSPHSQLNSLRRGWDRFYLDRPMVREPGTHFLYDSGAVIVTSSLLEARSGQHADAWAERHLFGPLGISRSDWYRNAEGHPHTGGGLDLRPRDMARFGLLYLRGGRWGDRQVVPASWVEASLKRHVDLDRGREVGYGYWWWVLEGDPDGKGQDIYAAMGFMGQFIVLVPEHDLLMVTTAGARREDQDRAIDFLYSHVLKAVHAE